MARRAVGLLIGALVLGLVQTTPATAGPPAHDPCAGATIVGTAHDDRLTGSDGDDIIYAGQGNDTVDGGGGNDVICGHNGEDVLVGGPGDDKLYGDNGKDRLRGGSGSDVLDGGNAKDVCSAGEKYVKCESTKADPGFTTTVTGSREAKATLHSEDRIPKFGLDVRGDYFRSQIALNKRASFAYEFTSRKPFTDAEITIPYFPKAKVLREGGDHANLRIYGYDEQYGLWSKVPGKHKVDTKKHTVTVRTKHFSLYTVFLETPGDPGLASYWESKPVWCLAKDDPNSPSFDVSFVVGGAASMATNDPNGTRVDAAKQFVDTMRATDRASVIGFNDTATTYAGLTTLDGPGAGTVKSALDRTRTAAGGNNLDEAVKAATRDLTATPGRGRPRVAVLISDGPGPLADTTINAARDNDIVFYTVGLGTGETSDLQRIALGTGGRYLPLQNPAQLPDLYRELSRDLIDDGTDTDADGVTDCVERRGALTAHGIYADDQPFKTGRYVRTDPLKPDTDGDSLTDGAELGPQLDVRAKPELAEQYRFLVDAGITRFFNPTSNPASADTDGEGLLDAEEKAVGTNAFIADTDRDGSTDFEEVKAGVTDPTRHDGWIWAGQNGTGGPALIPGLAPLTLVKPETNDYPWDFDVLVWGTDGERQGDCVAYCKEIYDWGQAEYEKQGWLCKLLTSCQPDDLRKEWIEQAVDVQGFFTYDEGHMREDFVRDFLTYNCQAVAARPEECTSETVEEKAEDEDYNYQDLAQAVVEILSVIPGGTRPPNDDIDTAHNKLKDLAKRACAETPREPGMSAQSWGKRVHAKFEELIQASGDATLFGETGYLNGQRVDKVGSRWPKDTSAPDAGFGTPDQPKALFDLKTGEKGIQATWLEDLKNNLKGLIPGSVPVFQLNC